MRVAYAHVIEDVFRLPGVFNKVRDQQKACRETGLPVDVHVFSYERPGQDTGGLAFHVLQKRPGKASKLFYQAREIAKTLAGYEVVVLRALAWTPMYVLGMRKKKFTLITEHHTKTLGELFSGKRFSALTSHALFKVPCLGLSDGLVCVTDEIRQNTKGRFFPKKPSLVIPNGMDVGSIEKTGSASFDGKSLDLAFVASTLQPWHGLDRLTRGLESHGGDIAIRLHLLGDIPPHAAAVKNPAVETVFHGVLDRGAMDQVLSRVHLGISSLAIFRNRMKEACVLKTREYMARGLPFVYAYDDPDIPDDFICCLKLSASQEPVDIRAMTDFARKMEEEKKAKNLAETMRKLALEKMDWKPKMRALADFCEQVLGRDAP